jgi:hypothetical protein
MSTNTPMRHPAALPWVLAGLAVYCLAVFVAMHVLQPGLDPIKEYMSVYVLGAYGAWMTTSFFAAAAIWSLFAFGAARALPPTWWTKAGIVLFYVASCGELLMGLFPTQYPVTPPFTQRGAIHLLSGLAAFNAIALGSAFLSVSFRGSARWKSVATPALVVSVLMFAMTNDRWLWRPGQGTDGLKQRVVVALMFLWFGLAVAPWIRSSTTGDGSPGR